MLVQPDNDLETARSYSVRRLPAGRPVDLSGNEARFVRREEYEQRCNLDWLRGALEGRVLSERANFLLWHGRRDEWRPDWPGRDGVHADAALHCHVGERLREVHDRPLGRRIGEQVGA